MGNRKIYKKDIHSSNCRYTLCHNMYIWVLFLVKMDHPSKYICQYIICICQHIIYICQNTYAKIHNPNNCFSNFLTHPQKAISTTTTIIIIIIIKLSQEWIKLHQKRKLKREQEDTANVCCSCRYLQIVIILFLISADVVFLFR